ncbi:2-dehydro-3-deoxy-D-gluconate 5-dehydrogenase KduD [Amphiplicatus metriothermophilus]|uniref:2-dehydro-3-deoxy-D-gluconate 5-dehydrogenase n=1 Tax=Amphiplicatus metriothermophilus TaxID=1519374 RepID=A0A239PU09_9PROT|nr:2-dehydro-3-deoxy-D-gluconate 5-dehydrogenase KduD [Amphiplicatus metriothermophilus]MBB5519389.1 2-deoxy-D-gluconate 3-dehydrogenase [Amphiplicatus metriothermophilus]SNT73523.1 2-deoxy-D-gluconate 3-dehydrogenase [Amphiplicatus metriothermophilus]
MPSAFDLSGKIALVTGANTGIGQGLAVGLAEAGADIAAVGRSDPAETRKIVEKAGCRFAFVEADLRDSARAEEIVAAAKKALGPVDILVNNAGVIRRNDALDFTQEDWDEVLDVNLKTVFFLSQAAAKRMVAAGRPGKIINIASMLSFQGGIRVASYTASKSGVAGLTKLLANEWASRGINVNAIAPGYIATNNTAALRADEKRNAEILGRIPAGRWGEPGDLAGAAVFLASPASDYVHGTILAVDGGWLAR